MAIPLAYNVRNLRVRLTTTIMTALGVALTVAVLLGILALVNGVSSALSVTGHEDQLLVMRQGATSELVSVVTKEQFDAIKFLDGIAQHEGEPMVSHEVISVTALPLRGDPTQEGNVNVRGISPVGRYLRDDLELIDGRWFETGKREVVVGQGIHAIRANTSIGDKVEFGRGQWEVVGVFSAGRSAYNSEIWADGNFAASDLGRGATRSSVIVRGRDAVAAQALKNRMADDQRLTLEAQFERDYYQKQMSSAAPIRVLGIFVAAIMAIGSSFAAMNTMYTAVARRSREIGTLRMLGFSRGSITLSFLIESLLLSVLGGLLGCVLILPLNGLESRLGNAVTFAETAFTFEITPDSLAIGMAFASIMGVLGGVLPARLASSRGILTSLREL